MPSIFKSLIGRVPFWPRPSREPFFTSSVLGEFAFLCDQYGFRVTASQASEHSMGYGQVIFRSQDNFVLVSLDRVDVFVEVGRGKDLAARTIQLPDLIRLLGDNPRQALQYTPPKKGRYRDRLHHMVSHRATVTRQYIQAILAIPEGQWRSIAR